MSQYQPPEGYYPQQQGYPQPQGYYNQPQWQQPPMQPQPPGKPRKQVPTAAKIGCGAAIAIFALVVTIAIATNGSASSSNNTANGAANQQATQPDNSATTAPLVWKTTHTFNGNGIKKTAIFPVPGDWKIKWSCTPSSFFGGQYNVQVTVYGSDGSMQDLAINEICKSGNTSGETEEHQAGDVYLDINSEGAWSIQVQELQ